MNQFSSLDAPSLKQSVTAYWDAKPCEAEDWSDTNLSLQYFERLAQHRYEKQPYIAEFAQFERYKDKRVLEIGVGAGSDFCRWRMAGARAAGIDLTQTAVELTQTNLRIRGLEAEVQQADAEQLPFADETFDLCYSFGVLHHTPDTEKAIREIKRVLKPGGEIRIMLYHIYSWVSLRTYLEHGLLRGKPLAAPGSLLASHKESPGTKAYTRRQVMGLFRDFSKVQLSVRLTTYDLWEEVHRAGVALRIAHYLWPRWLVNAIGNRFGWNILISGVKP